MKFIVSLLTCIAILLCFSSVVYADDTPSTYHIQHYGIPQGTDTTILNCEEWDGESQLKGDTCYFINKPIEVTQSHSLPESSMLVIENGGYLNVDRKVGLYINGALVIHSKASLTLDGILWLKSNSVCVVNGRMLINTSGRAYLWGHLQISSGGTLGVKGKFYSRDDGMIECFGTVKQMDQKAIMPYYTLSDENDKPLYFVDEMYGYLHNDVVIIGPFDNYQQIPDTDSKKSLIHSFESVLYKYSGDYSFDLHDDVTFELNPQYSLTIYNDFSQGFSKDNLLYFTAIYPWNGKKAYYSSTGGKSTGSFYLATIGRPNPELFSAVNISL